ncbi:unnamed protein product [Ectocarpus sp. CCAP 1310/34]|nr:unnamed protein product [Ectocarpus sp. CCAP 1310/34]
MAMREHTLLVSSRGEGAPSNHVAGLGRGAVGFTNRSDIGPARTTIAELGATGPRGATGASCGVSKDPDFGPVPVDTSPAVGM